MRRRIKQGFTLVEMLVALLILSLLTGTIALGTSVGSRIYQDSMFTSESALLSATIDAALGDILHYAEYRSTGSTGSVGFDNRNYGIDGGHFRLSEGGEILISPYGTAPKEEWLILVSSGAYTSLQIDSFDLDYADGIFSGGYTIADAAGTRSTEITFAFRTLMAGD